MSGRGCSITISLLGSGGNVEDIRLPVALHSPLLVLKQQLQTLVGIEVNNQVLILLDLTDPNRNNDLLLLGRDHASLRECGIKFDSTLTLHALGINAEKKQAALRDKLFESLHKAHVSKVLRPQEVVHTIQTSITAADADHSYNGIIFDVMCKSPYEISIESISLAGMLGPIKIFVRDRPWKEDLRNRSNMGYGHSASMSREGWKLVAERDCRPSWDRPLELKFDEPVVLHPNCVRAFYCHSSLQDDLGIQYQSYRENDIIEENDDISIHPGLGHTGSEPFDDTYGWYRKYRGLAGAISYKRHMKGWMIESHSSFPNIVKKNVVQVLNCQNQCSRDNESIGKLPLFLIYNILEYITWDWFENLWENYSDQTLEQYHIWSTSWKFKDPIKIIKDDAESFESRSSPDQSIPRSLDIIQNMILQLTGGNQNFTYSFTGYDDMEVEEVDFDDEEEDDSSDYVDDENEGVEYLEDEDDDDSSDYVDENTVDEVNDDDDDDETI